MHRSVVFGRVLRGTPGALVFLFAVFAAQAAAQLPGITMPPQDTVLTGGTLITMDGDVIANGRLIVSGKKIRAIGPAASISDDAEKSAAGGPPAAKPRVVDITGKYVMPVLIDASSRLGADPTIGREVATASIIDRIDLFNRDDFADALAQGVAYGFLGTPVVMGGVGGRGAAITFANGVRDEAKEIVLDRSDALLMAVGTQAGPIARLAEITRLAAELRATKKYEEDWEQYKENLKKYEKALEEKAKKGPSSQPSTPSPAPRVEQPSPTPFPAPNPERRRPFPRRERSAEHGSNATFTSWVEYMRLLLNPPPPILTNPHVCAVCSGTDHPEEAHGFVGFDFYEFAAPFYFEDVPQSGPGSQPGSAPNPAAAADQKPQEPAFDPAREELLRVLNGKLRVRIAVDRAEDILNLLKLLSEFPMDCVLEGVEEGWLVADDIAKSGYPVLLAPRYALPAQEELRTAPQQLPFNFPMDIDPSFFPQTQGAGANAAAMMSGPWNAAVLAHAGVKFAIASVGEGAAATPQLLSAAAIAAGAGLAKDDALRAVTKSAAEICGVADRLGTLQAGKLASFVVLSGEPFAPDTVVEQVFVEGRRVYSKK